MTNEQNRRPDLWRDRYARGDIVYVDSCAEWTDGHEQRPGRPAIIVSPAVNETCMVVYLTTNQSRKNRVHVPISTAAKPSIALCDQIKTIDARHLGHRYGRVTAEELETVAEAVQLALGIEPDGRLVQELRRQLIEAQAEAKVWREVAEKATTGKGLTLIGKKSGVDWLIETAEIAGNCRNCPARSRCHRTDQSEDAAGVPLERRKTCGDMLREEIATVTMPDPPKPKKKKNPKRRKRKC